MELRVFETKEASGRCAAAWCGGIINKAIRDQGYARIILATGASQFAFLQSFIQLPIAWDRITCFHLDEYVGLEKTHPASFRNYLESRVWSKVSPPMGQIYELDPEDIDSYAKLLAEGDIDLGCIGVGENGHIAFNDPPVAKFDDPELVKLVELDFACRQQQVGEGWFPSLEETPTKAATLTVPAIMRCKALSVVIPEFRKAAAVRDAILGPLSTGCPASILRSHGQCILWLDQESVSLYKEANESKSVSDRPAPTVDFPGLVDLQINGFQGVDFSSKDLTNETFRQACLNILNGGVALFLPTVITSTEDTYKHVLPIIADTIMTDEVLRRCTPGIHLEGPFISSQDGARGCHNKNNILAPNIQFFEKLQRLAKGTIRLLTIAAELDGAEELCSYACAQGVCVSLGHQMAGSNHLSALCRSGAKMLTHLGNGIPQFLDRHHNSVWPSLANKRLTAGIITDGHHLSKDLISTIIRAKGKENIIVTSDMAPFAGQKPGDYSFAGQEVTLQKDGKGVLKGSQLLAGSSSTTLQCANFLLGKDLASLEDVKQFCFTNPLKLLGIKASDVLHSSSRKLVYKPVSRTLELTNTNSGQI